MGSYLISLGSFFFLLEPNRTYSYRSSENKVEAVEERTQSQRKK